MDLVKIIIAGGSSGGHIFPGIALADQLVKKNSEVAFIGIGTLLEKKILKNTKYPFFNIYKMNIKKSNIFLKLIKELPINLLEVKNILNDFKPKLIISMGGYPAIPVAIVAKIKMIPLVVCEQNILPGRANRLLFNIADRIYKSFDYTIGLEKNNKAIFSGNPIRENILNINKLKNPISYFSQMESEITILILGGSQGAHAINMAVIDSLKHINIQKKYNLKFIHQSGLKDENVVREKYKSEKINAEVKSFFKNMALCYLKSDIVICRAGATTISELMALGKCSLLIPYPFATENHQLINAQYLSKIGGSKIIYQANLSGLNLAKHINRLINNPKIISKMASNAKTAGVCNSAKVIANDIFKILRKKECS